MLGEAFEAGGFHVEQVAAGKPALTYLLTTPCDGLIFDMDVVDLDGVLFMQQARITQPELVIIALTTQPTLESAIAAIRVGAADYLLKPVSISTVTESVKNALEKQDIQKKQLVQSVRGALHTTQEASLFPARKRLTNPERPGTDSQIIIVSPFRLDQSKRLVTRTDDPTRTIKLTRGEAVVLAALMTHPSQILTSQEIAHIAWHYKLDLRESGNLVRPYISHLRRKLEASPKDPQFIVTIRGQGYLFAPRRRNSSII